MEAPVTVNIKDAMVTAGNYQSCRGQLELSKLWWPQLEKTVPGYVLIQYFLVYMLRIQV
jgi:hypothetical protein